MTLVKFNPSKKNLNGSMPAINSVFYDRPAMLVPAANISESAEKFHLELAAPGLKKADFKLKLEKDVLSISVDHSNQNTDETRNYTKREFSYSSFMRTFNLPESANAEGITASYQDGVLSIDIPKREEAKVVTRQIEIK